MFRAALLVGVDIAILYAVLWSVLWFRFGDPLASGAWGQHVLPFSLLYGLWLLVFHAFGLYNLGLTKNSFAFLFALSRSLGACFFLAVIFFYFTPFFGIAPKTNLFLVTLLAFLFLGLWRLLYNMQARHPYHVQSVIVIGQNAHALELQEHLAQNPQFGYKISAIIRPEEQELNLLSLSKEHTILAAFDLHAYPKLTQTLFSFVPELWFESLASFYERITGKVPLSQIDEIWFLHNLRERERSAYETLKRITDILSGLVLGLFALLFLPLVAIALLLESPGSLFYAQQRVGKNGKVFTLWKFRSMVPNAEENGAAWAQKNDPRVTKAGNILRKTFIDELPQAINILKGDMSLVGPRPERPEFVQSLSEEIPFYQIRHLVKPGITGWAQVNSPYGNSTQGALEKLQYDLYYLKNRSLMLDLDILLKTVNVVFKGGTQ